MLFSKKSISRRSMCGRGSGLTCALFGFNPCRAYMWVLYERKYSLGIG